MKLPVIILSILCVCLGAAWYLSRSGAEKQRVADVETIQSLSKKLTELDTRMMLAQSDALVIQSNLQSNFQVQAQQLTSTSNRLAQTHARLLSTQESLELAQAQVASQASRIPVLEQERNVLQNQLKSLETVNMDLEAAQAQLRSAQEKIRTLTAEAGGLRVQLAQLQQQVVDPSFLETQLAKAETLEKARQRAVNRQQTKRQDLKAPIALQPDGTVTVAVEVSEQLD